MKVNLKRGEIINLWNTLETMRQIEGSPKFTNALTKNKKLVEKEVKAIREVITPSPDYSGYEKEMIALEAGYTDQGKTELGKRIEELKMMHKKWLEEQAQANIQPDEFFYEEITFDFYPIYVDDCPEMSVEQMEAIYPFVVSGNS